MMTPHRFASVVLLVALAASCRKKPVPECTDELGMSYSPFDTTISVGGQFTQRVALSSCGGRKKLSNRISWRSADPTIATVDPISGVVRGVAAGSTLLWPDTKPNLGISAVRVTVR